MEGRQKGAIRNAERKEGNLSRVDCNGDGRLRDLGVRNIGRENSKGQKEKGQAEKEPVLAVYSHCGESKRNRRRVGKRGEVNESGRAKSWEGETMGEGAVGVRKLISIRSRETIMRRMDLKNTQYMKIFHFFTQVLSNVTFFSMCFCAKSENIIRKFNKQNFPFSLHLSINFSRVCYDRSQLHLYKYMEIYLTYNIIIY